jgi:hypothetical protein
VTQMNTDLKSAMPRLGCGTRRVMNGRVSSLR